MKYNIGDTAWIVENGSKIAEVVIKNISGGFFTVIKLQTKTALRLKEHRLFESEETAKATLPRPKNPYDWM